jgi:D-alanyl-D-alanine carboxypeptidase
MRRFARRFLLAVFVAVAAATMTPAAQAKIPLFTSQPKYAAIVVDAKTGEVLYAQQADSPRYPASITKIMTLYLAFEAISKGTLSPNDLITVSPRAAAQAPTKLGLRAGQTIPVIEAMTAISVMSANDMAVALAEKIGGSESRFAALMTLKAQALGMTNSHFVNANGLPDSRQITSARDIAILSRAVMRDYPQDYAFFGKRQFTWRGRTVANHNHLLGKMPGVDGIKTGFTNASGFNLAASAVRDDRRLIAVVMGGNSVAARDSHVADLLETGFTVLKKRDRGVATTIAQNLSEPAPIGPLVRPSTEQGDGEQDGVKIVVAENGLRNPQTTEAAAPQATPNAPAKIQKARAPASGRKARPAPVELASTAHGAWQVQLGAYKNRRVAQAELAKLNHKYAAVLKASKGRVDRSAGNYRVRFAGLSADRAKEACETIKAGGANCMALEPG